MTNNFIKYSKKTSMIVILSMTVFFFFALGSYANENQGIAAQSADSVYELADIDVPPHVIRAFPPAYPFSAKQDKIEGRIVVEFIVTKDGTPKDVWVIDAAPPDIFEDAALNAVRQYQFAAGIKDDEAVDVRVKLPIQFLLDEIHQLDPETMDRISMAHEMSEVDQPPHVIRAFPPAYPLSAKQDKIEGRVLLKFVVDIDGRAKEPLVVMAAPYDVFEEAAIEAITHYKFEPAILNGTPVACIVQMPVVFKLDTENSPSNTVREKAVSFKINGDIKILINHVGYLTGNRYVIDDDVKGKLSLKTPSLSIDEHITLFESILDKHGYVAVPSGDVIRIMKK